MNPRGRFNSPKFSAFGHSNSPDMNFKSNNAGLRNSMSPDFIPFQYSSPLSSFKSNDNRNRRNYHRGSMRIQDRSFNSPQSGGSNFNSPYNSSGFNNSGDFRKNFNHRRGNNQNPNSSAYNSKMYFNESMIKDPWEDLEKQSKEEKEINIFQTSTNKSKNTNDNDLGSESDEISTKVDDVDADRNSSSDEKDDLSSSIHTTTTLNTTNSDS